MGIFKCLQRLYRFSRSSRLFQWLFIAGSLALIIGIPFLKKSHEEEKAYTCFKNKEVVFFFHASEALTPHMSLPIKSMQVLKNLAFNDVAIKGTKWKIAALRVFSIGDLMAELSMKGGENCFFPMIVVAQDSAGAEYLIVGNEERQISLSSMSYLVKHCLVDQRNGQWVKVNISDSKKNDGDLLSLCMNLSAK
jgi:hypothetical protein